MKYTIVFLSFLFCAAQQLMAQSNAVSLPRNEQLRFTENKGQWNNRIAFRADIPNGQLLLEKNAFYFFLYDNNDLTKIQHPANKTAVTVHGHAFKEEFLGANPQPEVMGANAFADYANYYIGNDPAHWAGGVKIFPELNYKDLYPGIDLRVYTKENSILKYDWIVRPGGNAADIRISYNGLDELRIKEGALSLKTTVGDMLEEKPFAYQTINGFKVEVKCNFVVSGNVVSLSFPDGYNGNETLIVDPTIIFSTYTGSRADNWGYTATYDAQQNMYVGGYVNATPALPTQQPLAYPTTVGAFQTTWGGGTGGNQNTGNGIRYACDMGITKFNATGTQLIYSTFIGGNDNETPHSLVVDPAGNLIIYGVSYSANYPVTANAYDNSYNGGGDIVVTKLNAAGTALIGSTFLGGDSVDGINFDPEEFTLGNLKRNYGDQNRGEVNVDGGNDIYVASCTKSANFPVTSGAVQSNFGGLQDGCVFKLNSNCSSLIYSTYVGGANYDACYSLDIGPAGTLYVAGGTMSSNFPTTSGTLHPNYLGGQYDGFLARLNATGTQLLSSSYIGTGGDDQVYFVKLDADNDVYFVGQTTGNYPVLNAAYSNPNSGQFIAKVKPDLTAVIFSTVFGNGNGQPNISPTAFLVDTCKNIYVAGWGCAPGSVFNQYGFTANVMTNLPLTQDALQSSTDGTDFYFIVLAKNAQNILYGSYFGANGNEEHVDGGTSRFDKRGVMYEAICAGCNKANGSPQTPTTSGVWSPTNQSNNCNELGLKIAFNLSGTQVAIDASPRATGCVPLNVQFQATSNASSIVWFFDDGASSNQTNPMHLYTDTGTYHVMLIGTDSNSCNIADTAYLDVWVRDDSIVANFLPTLNIDCYNRNVSVRSVSYPSAHYQWSMGDGSQFTTDSVAHVYANPGTYNISLVVTDTTRCSLAATFNTQVTIPALVDASFAVSNSNGCAPLTVNFSEPFIPTSNYYWSFGDGSTSSQSTITHTFVNPGNYQVRLIVIDSTSCNMVDTAYATIVVIDSTADADFNFSRTFFGCDSVQITAWSTYQGEDSELWTFGDGTQQANSDTVHHVYNTAGTFVITHYLADASKICKPLDTAKIAISLVPLNVFITVPDTGGCLPFNATLIGNSVLFSTDFTWYLGDGSVLTGDTVSHTYTQVGTYNVVAVAVDTNACVGADSAFAQITVIDDSVHADFNITVLNDCDSNLVVDLQNTSTNAVDFMWGFGDGTTSVLQNENHSYSLPATYTITLIVQDTNRCHPLDTIAKNVTLKPNLFVDFTATNVCAGTPVVINNLCNPLANFVWNFNDGSTSNLFAPSHLYSSIGTKTIQLTITDTSTCDVTGSVTHEVEVYPQPVANFTTLGDTFKFEEPVAFLNRSYAYQNVLWSFGDGQNSDDENPVHTYESIYGMNVCLKAYNDVCADTICKNIYISFTGLVGVPNAFSPNGDGVNDVVKVEGRGIVDLTFRIYNRWGEKVFETHDKNIGWDGIYKGMLQEMEVYTYAVEATLINGETVPLKGNITLLR